MCVDRRYVGIWCDNEKSNWIDYGYSDRSKRIEIK